MKYVGAYLYVLSGMAVKCGLSQEIRQLPQHPGYFIELAPRGCWGNWHIH